jgi:hypothetical protein
MVGPYRYTREGSIDEDENGINGVDVRLDLSFNTLLLKGILLSASVDEARGVEDADLGKRLCMLIKFTYARAYHYAVLARTFVNPR